jgi:hypothetical protein
MVRSIRSSHRGRPARADRAGHLLTFAFAVALMAILGAASSADAESISGSVTMVSASGDYIGGGTDRLWDAPGTISITGGASHEVRASGEGGEFTFDLAPPSGSQLEVGEYKGAERYPFEPAGVAGIDVSGSVLHARSVVVARDALGATGTSATVVAIRRAVRR